MPLEAGEKRGSATKAANAQYTDGLDEQMVPMDWKHVVETGFQGLQSHKLLKEADAAKTVL